MTAGSDTGPVRLVAVVSGRVQGVGYRYFVLATATARGITGWVANQADGSVKCVAEGPRPRLEAFASELEQGPFSARVESVQVTWGIAAGGFIRFEVRSGSHSGD